MKSPNQKFITAIITAIAASVPFASLTPVFAKHFAEEQSASYTLPQQTNLLRLRKADNLCTVLEDAEVKESMKESMGSAVQKYFDTTQIMELPNVKGNDLYSAGGISGLFTICESFFNINLLTKKVVIVLLDDDKLSIYGAADETELPAPVQEYIEDLQLRVSTRLKISFEKPSRTPFIAVKKSDPSKI